jgi:hypothetical protein
VPAARFWLLPTLSVSPIMQCHRECGDTGSNTSLLTLLLYQLAGVYAFICFHPFRVSLNAVPLRMGDTERNMTLLLPTCPRHANPNAGRDTSGGGISILLPPCPPTHRPIIFGDGGGIKKQHSGDGLPDLQLRGYGEAILNYL